VVPAGAVPDGETYTVTMDSAPCFICTQHNPPDGYRLFAVKEFTEIEQRHFNKHVQIFMHLLVQGEKTPTSDGLRIRYSTTDKKHFAVADYILSHTLTSITDLPDVYYTFDETLHRITIHTKHFTLFKIESKENITVGCKATREVTLVADVYGKKLLENNSLEICVYIRDILVQNEDTYFEKNNVRENLNGRQSMLLGRHLKKLPAAIYANTQFDCVLLFHENIWEDYSLELQVNFLFIWRN
jgi:hypothetical protein